MNGRDVLKLSVANLGRRKGRTILTLIGVIIGVGALVLMVSLGIGLKLESLKFFESDYMVRSLFVSPRQEGESGFGHGPGNAMGPMKMISEEEIKSIETLSHVFSVTPHLGLYLRLDLEGAVSPDVQVRGIPEEERKMLSSYLTKGRLWKNDDVKECVFPSSYFEKEHKSPEAYLGKEVQLSAKKGSKDKETFVLVGVVDSRRLGFLLGSQLFLPKKQAMRIHKETKGGRWAWRYEEGKYMQVEVKVDEFKNQGALQTSIQNKGFNVEAISDIIRGINTAFLVVEGFFGCVGAIGLIVALFGIANTMTMSVLERTREIGILKALGARKKVIRRLFLLEAGWIGLLGGALGLLIGWLFGLAINGIGHLVFELPDDVSLFHVSLWLACGVMVFSILVSMGAGLIPAIRAARKDPVQALRHQA